MISAKLKGEDLHKRATRLYVLVGVLVLSGSLLLDSFPWLWWLSKPLIVPALYIWWNEGRRGDQRIGQRYFLLALAGSWWGDLALMFSGEGAFVLGLLGFLVGHLGYIAAFNRPGPPPGARRAPWSIVAALGIYGVVLVVLLWPDLGPLKAPVLVYAAVLTGMAGSVAALRGRVRPIAYPWLLGGALLFVLSDSLIAVTKFATPIAGSNFLIMATYLAAQYGLTRGWMLHTQPS